MKAAAILTLAFAIILAIWVVSDWIENVNNEQRHVQSAWGSLSDRDMSRVQRDTELERQDCFIGIVAVIALIGSVVMFAKNKKSNDADEIGKKCPACAEIAKAEALICRFCAHKFDSSEPQPRANHKVEG